MVKEEFFREKYSGSKRIDKYLTEEYNEEDFEENFNEEDEEL